MQKYENPLQGVTDEDMGKNPCATSMKIPIRLVSPDNQYYIDEDGDKLPVEIDLEYTPYSKLYTVADARKYITKLTSASKSLWLWIMYEVPHGKDYLWVNKERYREESSVSYKTYKKAVGELHKFALISPTTYKDVYWINPQFFFKGNRIEKYKDKVFEYMPKTRRKYSNLYGKKYG